MYKRLNIIKFSCAALVLGMLAGCNDEVDNAYSRNQYNLEMTASSEAIVLNESTPDAVALTIEWTPAVDHGYDYITEYLYEVDLIGGTTGDALDEYIDDGNFKISYTHKELQDLLVDDWKQLTSTTASVKFGVTASTEGPTLVIPEMGSVTVKIKTYGATQFKADKMFMSGSAVGTADVEILQASGNANLFVYQGNLSAGNLNFPVIYDDEDKLNSIAPTTATQTITEEPMTAVITPKASAGVWVIPEADKYRVTVDMANKTVTIIPAGDIIEFDKMYLSGTAVGEDDIEVTQTLENESLYAWRGELTAGTLYLPLLLNEDTENSIVPSGTSSQNISEIDGLTSDFNQADTYDAQATRHWIVEADGVYRIVVNIDLKKITIYSPATDLPNKTVSYNNTAEGINPYQQEVTKLWMWGGFNNFKGGMGGGNEFSETLTLTQSLANPYIFVYKGAVLPNDIYKGQQGYMNFKVSSVLNNVYAYGSTADAKRNEYDGFITTTHGARFDMVGGQGDNRYAFFTTPANTNYVEVDIENMTVVFDSK